MSCSYTDYFDLIVFAGDHNVCPSNSAAQNDTGIANALAAANTPVDFKTAILLPPGRLWFSKTILINKSNVSLLGMGKGQTVLSFQPSTDKVAIKLASDSDGLENNLIANFTLVAYLSGPDGQKSSVADTGISVEIGSGSSPARMSFEHLEILSFRDETDVEADKVGLRIGELITSRFVKVECHSNNIGCKIETPEQNKTTSLTFESCVFRQNKNIGLWLEDRLRGISFGGSCVIESNGGPGIYVKAPTFIYNLKFYNIWIEGNNEDSSLTDFPYGVYMSTSGGSGGAIDNLLLTGVVAADGLTNGGGIYVENVNGRIDAIIDTDGTLPNRTALKIGTPEANLNLFGTWNTGTAPIDPDGKAQTFENFPLTYKQGNDGTFMIDKQISNSISLTTQTESGSDNQALFLASHKGGLTSSRGAYISLYGNNFTGQTGNLALTAGSSGVIRVNSPAEFNGTGTLNKIDFGSDTVTTNASGVVEVPHGLGVVPTYGMVTPGDNADPYIINIVSFDSANMEIKVFETSGSPYQGTLDLYYEVRN